MESRSDVSQATSLSLIENVDIQAVQTTLTKIQQFQTLVRSTLQQNHDFGIIPGTDKPTLLKPGAEKILMLMGIVSEYELAEKVQDYEAGFFAFTVKCTLLKNGMKITEGLGHSNTKEKRNNNRDPFTLANTCLKMAKKRAQVDATLTVASLSSIFAQDLEDMDLEGNTPAANRTTHDDERVISEGQAKRLLSVDIGNSDPRRLTGGDDILLMFFS